MHYEIFALKKAFQVALVVKKLPAKAGDKRRPGSIPGSGRSPGEGNANPFQYFCLENLWIEATVHGVTNRED